MTLDLDVPRNPSYKVCCMEDQYRAMACGFMPWRQEIPKLLQLSSVESSGMVQCLVGQPLEGQAQGKENMKVVLLKKHGSSTSSSCCCCCFSLATQIKVVQVTQVESPLGFVIGSPNRL